MLIVGLTSSAVPVTAQDQTGGARSFDFRDTALGAGPLSRAAIREAVRLGAEDLTTSFVDADGGKSGKSDWSRVLRLGGKEIILTVHGSPPGKRYVVRGTVDESGLTVLNLTDPAIPAAVKDALADTGASHPDYFDKVRRGVTLQLNRHVRLAPDGVFLDGRRVGELSQLVEPVVRNSVAEISVMHSAARRGMAWGALIGGAIGLAVVVSSCGTDWSQETTSCTNLTGLWLFVGPIYGTGIGGLYGATFRISSVVYRAPGTDSLPRTP
jgi:hypothetical protein